MRKKDLRRPGRIAVGFFAFLMLSVLIPANCFAALSGTTAKVVYAGDGTTSAVQTLNAANLDTFRNLMPGGSTAPQNIVIENRSSQKMAVYFQAQPTDSAQVKLLDALQLKVTFKMDDNSAELILYNGSASGKNGSSAVSDIVTSPVRLGYVYGSSTSGVISAVLTAPETMGNQYELAQANLKWTLQFEVTSAPSSAPPPESIGENSTPLVGPSSVKPASSTPAGEVIPDNGVPLSPPPKTGQDILIPILVAAAAAVSLSVFLIGKRKAE